MQLFERTLGQWLEHWAEETPDKEYIVYSDRNLRFTWSQLNQRVDDMAKGDVYKRQPSSCSGAGIFSIIQSSSGVMVSVGLSLIHILLLGIYKRDSIREKFL